ncbi:MAG TPA: hypothetical protein VK177_07160 [Flavobacteriales bacterium]|nr:hypothetical protein [Flavobacteriales bacterium]
MIRFFAIFNLLIVCGANVFGQQTNTETHTKNKAVLSNSNYNNINPAANELNNPTQDVRSQGYYKTEADAFERQAKEQPQSSQAWLNLYKSSLYSYYTSSSKNLSATQKQELNEILEEMKAKVPGSFEYNIAVYLNGQHNTSLIANLARAAEVNPNQLDVLEQYVAYYAITDNDAKLKEYVQKHRKVSKYESFIDEYAYNLLQSLDNNGVLFTHGVMDTYPVYNQQLNQKVNAGIEIINIDYLNSETYRDALAKRLGIAISFNGNTYATAFDIASKLEATRSVYFSSAFSKAELKKHEAKLELNGLAFRYGTAKPDATKIESLWSGKFKKDQLEKTNMSDDYAKKMANNYLPVLITVYKFYTAENKDKEAANAKSLAIKIAKINGNEKQVNELFN